MNAFSLSDLWNGPLGAVLSYTIILSILLVNLLVSIRLLLTRRKIGYFSLMLSLLILMTQYVQLTVFEFTQDQSDVSNFVAMLLKLLSFLLINTGMYQLYNPTKWKDSVVFLLCLGVTIAVSATYWFIPDWLQGGGEQIPMLKPLGMDLYLFLLIFVSFLLVNPRIGQNGKYQVMLTLYFCSHMIHMANMYLFGNSQTVLTKFEQLIPMAFHLVLFLFIFERIIEIMQAIYHSSITDGLTKLYNRKYFYNRVAQHIAQKINVSVIFSDIDNFKKLNDTKGHHMGDLVLKQVAQIVKEEAEEVGICGRYGGEEMVVLVTDSEVNANELAERIRTRVEAETIVTVSMGFSRYSKNISADELIKQADEAMYKAKTSGKNKVVAF
ncbi:GGDEF domain-containing protein [Paenibacillus doosanensis]|uniref:Diguanylate cyclase YcdT n=1 Tax=Paenibacillus konkukensis TaxID=2020716 RepID=A0ABY4RJW6_9BACL|nr:MULTISPECIES: GGDEF domain-containing protein [Paenibacillus]MCS7460112.1 GGDEF domain-containing protein [Paenibacillus doosanensis]UQZ82767.1 putative diguanylate cyclase YcdT [Paenibacillus konkukensis]